MHERAALLNVAFVYPRASTTGIVLALHLASVVERDWHIMFDADGSLLGIAGDNRVGIIATLFLPVVGWVLFNIGGPALNQLANTGKNASRR